MHRFYLPDMGTANVVWLDHENARHALRVLRLRQGDTVALFDGSGVECTGVLDRVERGRARVAVTGREWVNRDPSLAVTLACSVVKAKAMDELVDKCAELGLRELVPVETRRSVPKLERKERAHLARWQRIAIEASKQCGRTTVTRIAPPRPLAAFLEKAGRWDLRLIFSPDDAALPLRSALYDHPHPRSVVYLVGPEGGFERAELRAAAGAGFEAVRMGRSVLRSETAAAAALAAILFHYEPPTPAIP